MRSGYDLLATGRLAPLRESEGGVLHVPLAKNAGKATQSPMALRSVKRRLWEARGDRSPCASVRNFELSSHPTFDPLVAGSYTDHQRPVHYQKQQGVE